MLLFVFLESAATVKRCSRCKSQPGFVVRLISKFCALAKLVTTEIMFLATLQLSLSFWIYDDNRNKHGIIATTQ